MHILLSIMGCSPVYLQMMEIFRVLQLYTLLTIVSTVQTAEDKLFHSAFFRHENTVHVTQQSWAISFKLDIEPYQQAQDRLALVYKQLVEADDNLRGVWTHINDTSTISLAAYRTIRQQQEEEFMELRVLVHELNVSLLRMGPLTTWSHERNKRSILPFVGDILGALFGTASSSDVREINRQLNVLAESDTQIRHVLQRTITVLNHTYIGTVENRQTINDLIEVSEGLKRQFLSLTSDVRGLLISFKHFTLRYLQIQQQLSMVYRSAVRFQAKLGRLKIMIDSALRGVVAQDMIPPQVLFNILRDIRGHLKSNLELPFPTHEPLEQYYRLLKCSVVPVTNGFLVITTIPLRDTVSEFDVYALQTIPIPYQGSDIVTSYEIREKFMAISMDRTKVTFLNEIELAMCTHEALQFCPIRSPIYKIAALRNNCALALFLERDDVQELCVPVVTTSSTPTPSAVSIGQGQWVISTQTPITFTKICEPSGTPQRITVPSPIGLISLGKGCRASSEYIILPMEITLGNSYKLDRVNFSIPTLMKIWSPVDKLLNRSLVRIPHKLKELVSMQPSMAALMTQLQQELPLMDTSMSSWEIASIVLAVVGFGIIGGVLIYCCYVRKFRNKIVRKPNPPTQRVRFVKNYDVTGHGEAVDVLGRGGDYVLCDDVTSRKITDHGNGMKRGNGNVYPGVSYEMVELNEEIGRVGEAVEGTTPTSNYTVLEGDGKEQKTRSVSPSHNSHERQRMSAGCVIRDPLRNQD